MVPGDTGACQPALLKLKMSYSELTLGMLRLAHHSAQAKPAGAFWMGLLHVKNLGDIS